VTIRAGNDALPLPVGNYTPVSLLGGPSAGMLQLTPAGAVYPTRLLPVLAPGEVHVWNVNPAGCA
jgi:hypothetical protein